MIKGLNETYSKVLQNFSLLTDIPRCSGEEERISNYLFQWAQERELEVYQDKALNVIIKKKASPGYEDHEPVLLQGHMDMVCEVSKGHDFDFTCQGIEAEIQDGYVVSYNTTLGADNGIAVAMIMTLFEDKEAIHPPLEALITVDEERGMTGAIQLEGKYIDARRLINLDSEAEGVCCVGCAGGQRDQVTFKKEFIDSKKDHFVALAIEGLSGGHSGQDIHEGRGNANRILARFLCELADKLDYDLVDFAGGSKSNAIPRDAHSKIAIDKKDLGLLKEQVKYWQDIFRKEYGDTDPGLKLELSQESREQVVHPNLKDHFISYLLLAPNGVSTMSTKVEGQVESSTNLGVVESTKEEWIVTSQVRSSVASKIQEISRRNELAARNLGAEFMADDAYPAWEYEPNSPIREKAAEVWKAFAKEDLVLETIHAGLECGLLQEVLGKMDMISIGPNMSGVHAPGERVSIESTDKVYEYVKLLLKEL